MGSYSLEAWTTGHDASGYTHHELPVRDILDDNGAGGHVSSVPDADSIDHRGPDPEERRRSDRDAASEGTCGTDGDEVAHHNIVTQHRPRVDQNVCTDLGISVDRGERCNVRTWPDDGVRRDPRSTRHEGEVILLVPAIYEPLTEFR